MAFCHVHKISARQGPGQPSPPWAAVIPWSYYPYLLTSLSSNISFIISLLTKIPQTVKKRKSEMACFTSYEPCLLSNVWQTAYSKSPLRFHKAADQDKPHAFLPLTHFWTEGPCPVFSISPACRLLLPTGLNSVQSSHIFVFILQERNKKKIYMYILCLQKETLNRILKWIKVGSMVSPILTWFLAAKKKHDSQLGALEQGWRQAQNHQTGMSEPKEKAKNTHKRRTLQTQSKTWKNITKRTY